MKAYEEEERRRREAAKLMRERFPFQPPPLIPKE